MAKVVDPAPTDGALRAAGLPSSSLLIRLLGTAEIGFALAGILFGGLAVLGAAVLYAGFTGFTLAAVRGHIPLQSCGCFGKEDTPPSWLHVGFNTIAAISLVWVAMNDLSPIPSGLPITETVIYTLYAAVGVYASLIMLTRLPLALRATSK